MLQLPNNFAHKKLFSLLLLMCTPILLGAQPSFPVSIIQQDLFNNPALMKKHQISHVTSSLFKLKDSDQAKQYYSLKDIKKGRILDSTTEELTTSKNKKTPDLYTYFGLDQKGRIFYESHSYTELSSNKWQNTQTLQPGKYNEYNKDGDFIACRTYVRNKRDTSQKLHCYSYLKFNYDEAGNIISSIPEKPNHAKAFFFYDAKNRLIEESTQNSSSNFHSKKEYSYNDKENSISAGMGTYFYNKQGQLIKTAYDFSKAKGGNKIIETRKYNQANKIAKINTVEIIEGQKSIEKTVYIYNSLGLLCREIKTSTNPISWNQYVKTYRYYSTKQR